MQIRPQFRPSVTSGAPRRTSLEVFVSITPATSPATDGRVRTMAGAKVGPVPPPEHRPPTRPRPVAPGHLNVVPWPDPVIDKLGHDPRSWYVEMFWLGVLGPSTVFLLRRIAAGFDLHPDGFSLDTEDTARAIGIGGRSGRHAPFQRTVTRCVTFEMARWQGTDVLAVRSALPPLARRHLQRLPDSLQLRHRHWVEAGSRPAAVDELRRRARRLALSLMVLDEPGTGIEGELVRRGIHPALAHEAVTWAVATRTTEADPPPPAAGPDETR